MGLNITELETDGVKVFLLIFLPGYRTQKFFYSSWKYSLCWHLASHLLHNWGKPPQSQATFIATGDHSTSELDDDPFGMTQFTAVCEGAAMGSPLGNCRGRRCYF